VSSTHLGLTTRFLLLSDNCGFVDVGRSLRQENGSAIYNCCWSSPAQLFLGLSPALALLSFFWPLLIAPLPPILAVCDPRYIVSTPTHRKHRFLYCCEGVFTEPLHSNGSYSIAPCVFVAVGVCTPSCCLTMTIFDFTISTFGIMSHYY
jgi:hypothetical protein